MNGAFDNGRKQQNGEQKVKHQFLDLRPHTAIQRGETAQQTADQNQSKVGDEELGVVQKENLDKDVEKDANLGFSIMRSPISRTIGLHYHSGRFASNLLN
jgi:hypothetical protein